MMEKAFTLGAHTRWGPVFSYLHRSLGTRAMVRGAHSNTVLGNELTLSFLFFSFLVFLLVSCRLSSNRVASPELSFDSSKPAAIELFMH